MKLTNFLLLIVMAVASRYAFSGEKKDFSFYKIQKTKDQIEISETDPRLMYLRGKFQGVFEGTTVELIIKDTESALNFYEHKKLDADVSFKKNNQELFFNVNENGNVVLILNEERRFFVNMKDWPTLILNEGYGNQVILKKVN